MQLACVVAVMLLSICSTARGFCSLRSSRCSVIRTVATGVRATKPTKDAAYRAQPSAKGDDEKKVKDRPFTLPPGLHKPLQSLGQNYLSDQNYVLKICDAFQDDSEGGHRVVEIGPGMGALTRVLMRKYPKMTAIEIDERSVRFLNEKLPGLNVLNQDIMKFDWGKLAVEKGGKLNVVANLPYYITSQVLFGLADAHRAINKAVVTMQWEVGERITAQPSTKDYGIPSVVFQLYGKTHLNFKIPPSVFFPVPKVDSALVTIDFSQPHKNLHLVEGVHLRRVITLAFRQRRKMLRQSLKELVDRDGVEMAVKWRTLRPEQLKPAQFIELTMDMYGPRGSETSNRALRQGERGEVESVGESATAVVTAAAGEKSATAAAEKKADRTTSTPAVGPASRRLAELLAKRSAKKTAAGGAAAGAAGEGHDSSKSAGAASMVTSAAAMRPVVAATQPAKVKGAAAAKEHNIYASELIWRKTLDSY